MTQPNWQQRTRENMLSLNPDELCIMHVPGSRPDHERRALGTLKRFYPTLKVCRAFDPAHVRHVRDMSALILCGGGDIHPSSYGQKPARGVPLLGVNQQRDQLEIALVREAVKHGIPVMGICRGMQVINVALGGSLTQDWSQTTRAPHEEYHWLDRAAAPLCHHLPILLVNSSHHQTIHGLGDGLEAVAHHKGSIEAIWKPGVLGVQWHPESLLVDNPAWVSLFMWVLKGGLQ